MLVLGAFDLPADGLRRTATVGAKCRKGTVGGALATTVSIGLFVNLGLCTPYIDRRGSEADERRRALRKKWQWRVGGLC
jgi:hypothetical protein